MTTPDRIWIAPTIHSNGVDDFYLLNPEFRGNRGTEYIRADTVKAQAAELVRLRAEVERLRTVVVALPVLTKQDPDDAYGVNDVDYIPRMEVLSLIDRAALAQTEEG